MKVVIRGQEEGLEPVVYFDLRKDDKGEGVYVYASQAAERNGFPILYITADGVKRIVLGGAAAHALSALAFQHLNRMVKIQLED